MRQFCQLDTSDANDLKELEKEILDYKDPELSNEFWQLVPNSATDKHFDCIFNYGTPIQWTQLAAIANNETVLSRTSTLLLECKHIEANKRFVLTCGPILNYKTLKKHIQLLLSLHALSDEIINLFPELSQRCIFEEQQAIKIAKKEKYYNRVKNLINDIKSID